MARDQVWMLGARDQVRMLGAGCWGLQVRRYDSIPGGLNAGCCG